MTLRFRLASWYGGLTATVVALACLYSYAVHGRTHYDELDRGLAATAEHVSEELGVARSRSDTAQVLSASLALGAGIRLVDMEGRLIGASKGAAHAPMFDLSMTAGRRRPTRPYPLVSQFAPELHHPEHPGGMYLLAGRDPDRWRGLVLNPGSSGVRLVSTVPLGAIDRAVAEFGYLMALLAAGGAIVAFGIGWLVAGHALRPVTALREAAATIARDRQFARRVAGGGADELGRLAETFNQMLSSLESAYAAQQRFVSDASHELRAPLTVIQANLELLRSSRALSPPDQAAALTEAHQEAARLSRLVADLLSLARADAGASLRTEEVSFDDLVLQVVGEAMHLSRGQRLRITALEPMRVTVDPDRMRQLLLILIENAIRYSAPQSTVSIAVRRDATGVQIRVEDRGIGIAPADLTHVFERFYRADPARTRDPGGTGLGLPIAKWIVEQHGGSLRLDTELARGTTAVVAIPG